MSSKNFLRTYTMKCGVKGSSGFEVGNIHSANEDALHISFSVEKCNVESPNTSKIQVWNLSPENLKILEQKDCIVELKAGYGNSNALISVGSVVSVITTADNANRLTEIEIMDGLVELRDTVISLSINGVVECKSVYDQIAVTMGAPIVYAEDITFKSMPNGFSFIGKAKEALQKIAEYCGHEWTIQNGVIQITLPGRPLTSVGYLLNAESGLIKIPKRISIGSSSDKKDAKTGWEIEYFLNGAIGVNDVIKLESSVASGYYLVYKVTLDGDNMEGDWVCTAQLLEIKVDSELDAKTSG